MPLKLVITNTKTYIEGASSSDKAVINGICSFDYSYYGMDFTLRPPRPAKKTDTISYFDRGATHFPTGWTSRVAKGLKEAGVDFQWVDKRVKPDYQLDYEAEGLFDLREKYQVPAFEEALQKTRGIIAHATGGGKTVLIYHLLNQLKLRSLIMVPDRNLLYQMYQGATKEDKGLIDFFPEEHCGIIGDGRWEPSSITVATVQTLWSGFKKRDPETMEFLNSIDFFAVDEAHHLSIAGRNKIKNSYYQIAQGLDSYYRYGFTATPGEKDSLERSLLEGATGRVIHRVSTSQLIRWGYLTPPTIHIYTMEKMRRIRNWQKAYNENILDNPKRNGTIKEVAEKFNAEGKTVLIIVKRVEDHGVVLQEMIPGSELMTGKTPQDERDQLLDDFSTKKLKTLISTIIKEGTNVPSMDVVIIAAGGKSIKAITQWIGRALRRSGGKDQAIVVDFMDQDNAILEKHSIKRISVYESEEEYTIIYM